MARKVMGMYRAHLGGTGGLPGRDLGPRLPYGRLVGTTCRRWELGLGKSTDCQCHHGAPWVLVLFGKTNRQPPGAFAGSIIIALFVAACIVVFLLTRPTQSLALSPAINRFAPRSGPSGKLLLAASVALQTLSGKAGQAKASHRSPSCCTQPSKPPIQPPAIFLCTKHCPHLSQAPAPAPVPGPVSFA